MTLVDVVAARRRDRGRRCCALAGAVEARLRAPDRRGDRRRRPRPARRPARRSRTSPTTQGLGVQRRRRRSRRGRRPAACWPSVGQRSTLGSTSPGRRAERAGRTAVAVGWDGAVRGVLVGRRHGQADLGPGGRRAARARPAPGAAHRRQRSAPPRRGGRPRSASTSVIAEVLPGGQGRRRSAGCRTRAGSWRWSATGSTTPPRWPRPTWASPWAPAPTWRSRPADLTLVRGDLRAAVDAIRLSRRTLRTIKGNLFWAFAYNVAAHPAGRGRAAQPDDRRRGDGVLSSVFVVTNSLRLRRFR